MSSELNIGKVNHFHLANKLSEISFVSWERKEETMDEGQIAKSSAVMQFCSSAVMQSCSHAVD
jgi:hypothetical protein